MKHTKKCRTCRWGMVKDQQAMDSWLAEVLGAEFRYAWSVRDELGREEPRLVHPAMYEAWMEHGPCRGCPCELRCDEICSLRARWWDARVQRLKKQWTMVN